MYSILNILFILGTVLIMRPAAAANCQVDKLEGPNVREGYLNFKTGRVWYRSVGKGSKTPLLVLHGGPGVPSRYLKPLAALAKDRMIVFYDQLGNGHSDRPRSTQFWSVERAVREIDQVRRALKLKTVHLYGHSWGAMLAHSYLVTQKTSGVKSVIFASPSLTQKKWDEDCLKLALTLPKPHSRAIENAESRKDFTSPEYKAAMAIFFKTFVARKSPVSEDLECTNEGFNNDINGYALGIDGFVTTGTLKHYDARPTLGKIKIPTLFMTGEYDQATPSTVSEYAKNIPAAKVEIVKGAGHLTMHDDPAQNNQIIETFLTSVE